jgi:myo-inositol-1(or 4)-monophosphatase
VSKRTQLKDCLISTGFPVPPGRQLPELPGHDGDVMQRTAGLRRPGAAALDLAYVAAGFTDGFFETGLSPWDVAAGSLLVTEAGGLVGNFTGEADFMEQQGMPGRQPAHLRPAGAHPGQVQQVCADPADVYARSTVGLDSADAADAEAAPPVPPAPRKTMRVRKAP